MERHAVNPFLVVLVLLVLSCPLVYPPSPPPPHHPYSSFPMPRSLRLGSQPQHLTDLKLTSSQETTIGTAMNMDRPEARMDLEVNDYPPPDHNHDHDHDHDPGHPPPNHDHDRDPQVTEEFEQSWTAGPPIIVRLY